MPFVMDLRPEGFVPAARCDQCGELVTAETGFVLWSLDPPAALGGSPVFVACDQECADALIARYPQLQFAALALDTYLVVLTEDELAIDSEAVREREELAWTLERTRDEVDQALD
ncbi:MAG: hypothetical protein RMJ05_05375 [Thermomicrobium sp.]|nr:hypothetical protein [Thermomicrobium sp.]MDW8006131.1 hypothetical protein [Thermomicrobium sp.]